MSLVLWFLQVVKHAQPFLWYQVLSPTVSCKALQPHHFCGIPPQHATHNTYAASIDNVPYIHSLRGYCVELYCLIHTAIVYLIHTAIIYLTHTAIILIHTAIIHTAIIYLTHTASIYLTHTAIIYLIQRAIIHLTHTAGKLLSLSITVWLCTSLLQEHSSGVILFSTNWSPGAGLEQWASRDVQLVTSVPLTLWPSVVTLERRATRAQMHNNSAARVISAILVDRVCSHGILIIAKIILGKNIYNGSRRSVTCACRRDSCLDYHYYANHSCM